MAYHVRIDHLTQGPSDNEIPADRFNVNGDDFLRIYVEAELPSSNVPKGEYYEMKSDTMGVKIALKPPELVNGQYRFLVLHYILHTKSKYLFRFSDDLSEPSFEDKWEIDTI